MKRSRFGEAQVTSSLEEQRAGIAFPMQYQKQPTCWTISKANRLNTVIDIPERQRKPDLEHHRQTDDLGAGLEVPEGYRGRDG